MTPWMGRWLAALLAFGGALAAGAAAAVAPVAAAAPGAPGPAGLWFDDFSDADVAGLALGGWRQRSAAGHPGVPGASWGTEPLTLIRDPQHPARQWLRLQASTDGTPQGTRQTQLCHERKLLRGTTAARVRLTDAPVQGADGDPVIQTFYSVAPLRHDFAPDFSEVDFEYLPNGGWGSPATRLYAISWQTVQVEPWQAWNSSHEAPGSLDGWHVLMTQVTDTAVHMYLDGRLLATHTGRNVPSVPMSANLNLWFSPGGLLPPSPGQPRVWQQDVDWVMHWQNKQLSPAEVLATVEQLRSAGVARHDSVPSAVPPLPSPCDF